VFIVMSSWAGVHTLFPRRRADRGVRAHQERGLLHSHDEHLLPFFNIFITLTAAREAAQLYKVDVNFMSF